MAEENGEKSFDPTPHRREEFKKQGKFAKSRDAGPVVVTAAVLAVLLGSRDAIGQAIHMLFLRCHGDLGALGRQDAGGVVQAAFGVLTVAAAPAMVAAVLAGASMSIVQSGGRMNDKFGFDPTRLNPLPGFMKLFSPMQGTKEAALSLLRVGVVGYVAYSALMREVPNLMVMSRGDFHAGTHGIIEAAVHVMTNALGALGLVAGIDYAQSRFSLEKEMKMTRKEIMDETKQQDGDPKIKMRMRQRARAMAKRRAMNNVKSATVIIANPTHISIALRYSKTDPAPIVVAKGHDDLAMQIRAEARKHGIPILENRPLARALDAEVPIGRPVPAAHFAAVARILAFVYKIKGKKL